MLDTTRAKLDNSGSRLKRHWYRWEMARTSSESPLSYALHITWMVALVITCYDLHCYLPLVFTNVCMPSFLFWYLVIIYLSLFHYWNMCWEHYTSLILLPTYCWSLFHGVLTTPPTSLTRTLRGSQRILGLSRMSYVSGVPMTYPSINIPGTCACHMGTHDPSLI